MMYKKIKKGICLLAAAVMLALPAFGLGDEPLADSIPAEGEPGEQGNLTQTS